MVSKVSQFYEICYEQLIAAGRNNDAEHFRVAKEAVNIAGMAFKKATNSIPESAKHSYMQGENYRLQAAKARIEGRNDEVESFSVAAVRAMIAGVNFEKAAKAENIKR